MRSNPLHTIRSRRRSDDGFTLIELLVVVVILGILIGIAIPVYLNYRKSANDKAAQSDVRNAVSTFEVCNSDGAYPTSIDTNNVLAGCSQTITVSDGTKLVYKPTGTVVTSYILFGANTAGSKKVYCYDSSKGGSVKASTTATFDGTAFAATTACP